MSLELLYFDGCPNWRVALERLTEALARSGRQDDHVDLVKVATPEEAEGLGFPGSPTVRLDGRDLFPGGGGIGFACRVYATPDGLAGSPTVSQLVDAIATAQRA